MHSLQRLHQHLVRHSFNDVSLGTCLEGAMNVLVSFVGCDYDETGAWVASENRFNGRDPIHPAKLQVHQGHIGLTSREQSHGFFPGFCLSDYGHIRARVDDRSYAHTQQRMVVHYHDFHFLGGVHSVLSRTSSLLSLRTAVRLRGTSINRSVPEPMRLFRMNFPPIRSTRSRIPISP